MNNLCFNRFTLRTDDAKTRRKILRWLAFNYRLYEYIPSDGEIRGRFISRKPFTSKQELAAWCKDNQPYYKKRIPGVVSYFARLYNLK